MLSLLFRNLFFTIIHPGLVAGLIPYWILGDKANGPFERALQFYQFLAMLLFLIGLIVLLESIIRFAIEGRGTLSPADPTKKLVIKGLYRFSRNPMYVGVIMTLAGEALFFQSLNLLVYLIFIFLIFNLFILLIEEPRLRKDFGEEYRKYCREVRRWY